MTSRDDLAILMPRYAEIPKPDRLIICNILRQFIMRSLVCITHDTFSFQSLKYTLIVWLLTPPKSRKLKVEFKNAKMGVALSGSVGAIVIPKVPSRPTIGNTTLAVTPSGICLSVLQPLKYMPASSFVDVVSIITSLAAQNCSAVQFNGISPWCVLVRV